MGNIIVVANQKGGVGKTTTAVNIATAMAAANKKILLIDFDPQSNASTGVGFFRKHSTNSLYDILLGRKTISESIVKTSIPGLSLLPSTIELIGAEIELVNMHNREFIFKKQISPYLSMFDILIIDCPPSMGLLTLNAFIAANCVLIPLQCEYYALEGLSYLLHSIQKIKTKFNPNLDLLGVVLTMFDKRSTLCDHVSKDVRKHLRDKVFDTVIPRNVKVSEAPSHGKPVLIYDTNCVGSIAYMNLAKEIISKDKLIQCVRKIS